MALLCGNDLKFPYFAFFLVFWVFVMISFVLIGFSLDLLNILKYVTCHNLTVTRTRELV